MVVVVLRLLELLHEVLEPDLGLVSDEFDALVEHADSFRQPLDGLLSLLRLRSQALRCGLSRG